MQQSLTDEAYNLFKRIDTLAYQRAATLVRAAWHKPFSYDARFHRLAHVTHRARERWHRRRAAELLRAELARLEVR